ncbi:glycosyltransferase [Sphingobacterium pedocola]|uniref:Glycosyltransferase n=1 Tax=Sphingobacterium pedocola TaxID=2082722 RepID=A0ABR9T5W6_9SPHI|nr:glycosyltransferase [Sphingobacterium pedocola]MBE8720735.1 glycosyltransferase [Sphingobacterium pedocola]
MFFSIVIPLYNRPQEIKELLKSLVSQTYGNFEVIVVEDGSMDSAKEIVESFSTDLQINYVFKENEGQGFARNYGFEKAKGDYFIVFDSDIIVPAEYLSIVLSSIQKNNWDAFGGPDATHYSFTPIQKAISYSMTSPFTTGGIRGNKRHVGQFHPRSFNMGISREVWQNTGGFKLSRRSEDIEFSIRMIGNGYKVGLIPEAFVYHKRRANFTQFYRQTYSFGKGRIDIAQLYPDELKLIHALPSCFTVGVIGLLILNFVNILTFDEIDLLHYLALIGNTLVLFFCGILFVHSLWVTKSIRVAILSVLASFIQLIAYGSGFVQHYIDRVGLKKNTVR